MTTCSKLGKISKISALTAALFIAAISLQWSRFELKFNYPKPQRTDPLYLPNIEKVKLITLGYDNLASNILWFNTLNYFGKQIAEDKDIKWLGHMCSLVSDLNPKATQAVEFCVTMLSWMAKEPKLSANLLDKAVLAEPGYWRLWYLRGFNSWYFLENKKQAKTDLAYAASLPGAPSFLASLASRLIAEEDNPHIAVQFLKELIQKTADQNAKKVLEERLKHGYVSEQLYYLKKKLEEFRKIKGASPKDLNDLVLAKIIPGIPKDPFGGTYSLDDSGQVVNTSGLTGLKFTGKTATTGLARFEKDR
jgi:hypothetical protein